MIDNFKKFIDKAKKIDPVLIPVAPVHGEHAKPRIRFQKLRLESSHEGYHHEDHPDEWMQKNHNEHLGKEHQDVHNKLDMFHKDFDKHPGSKHVKKYTDWSHDINHNLLAKHIGKKKTWAKTEYHTVHDNDHNKAAKRNHYTTVAGIDRALKKSKLKHDVHVFHGTRNWHPGDQAAKHPEGHVKSAAYLSTSIHQHMAHRFAGARHDPDIAHILHIHMKKGQHAMYVGSNSHHDNEKEMLLPRNTTLKIHPKPTKLSCGTHVWHAHVVD